MAQNIFENLRIGLIGINNDEEAIDLCQTMGIIPSSEDCETHANCTDCEAPMKAQMTPHISLIGECGNYSSNEKLIKQL